MIEFRTRGFTAARIEDIAKHAGLSKGTVYLYFHSKEDMLKALVRRTIKPIADNIGLLAARKLAETEQSKAVKVADILRTILSMAATRITDPKVNSIPLLIIGESGKFPELVQIYRDEVLDAVMGSLTQLLSHGMKTGEFRAINPPLAVRSLMGVMLMQVIWNSVFLKPGEKPISGEDIIKSHLDLFFNGALMQRET